MPALDMPLDKLREYRGRNPRPAGFDAYWDRNLAALDQLDPHVELREAAFQVPGVRCFDLRFTGTGGARVYAKYLRPAATKPRSHPAMLEFHGYTMDSGAWSSKLALVAQGFISQNAVDDAMRRRFRAAASCEPEGFHLNRQPRFSSASASV